MGAHAAPTPRGGRATAKIAFGESTASVFSASSAILQIRSSRTQWPNGPAMPDLRFALPGECFVKISF